MRFFHGKNQERHGRRFPAPRHRAKSRGAGRGCGKAGSGSLSAGSKHKRGIRILSSGQDRKVKFGVADTPEKLHVEAVCRSGGDSARVVISGSHTNIVRIERNGSVLFEKTGETVECGEEIDEVPQLTVESIFEFSTTAAFDDIRFILDGAKMNRLLAEEGLRGEWGLQVGRKVMEHVEKGILSERTAIRRGVLLRRAGDARMAGPNSPHE